MRGFKSVLSLTVACVFVSSTFAQAPIKKPQKKQQATTTTTMTQQNQKPNTSTNSQPSSSISTTATATKPTTGTINGHEWVDLGLSVKWATCNVGAVSPSDYGNYYAWGETSIKLSYTEENSKTSGKDMGNIAGNSTYDAARANWGGTWRLPTESEAGDLLNKCTWAWTTQDGIKGYKVTAPNGNSIFLPAAGERFKTSLQNAGERGYYWSATPHEWSRADARFLKFSSGMYSIATLNRNYGMPIRPVTE